MTKPSLSIIIPSWFKEGQDGKFGKNETYMIAAECLSRLIEVTPKELYQLIVVDNGSTLEEYDCNKVCSPREYFSWPDILIRNKENLGFAPAINQGIALANTEYIMQMNNDILVWEGFVEQMLEDFIKKEKEFSPNVGLLMPAIIKEKINFWDVLKMEKEEINMTTNAGQFGPAAEFGSCYLGRREMFIKVAQNRDGYQVLDENFQIGFGEDRWLYREIRMLGLETYRTHNVRVLHVGNLSMGKKKQEPGTREAIDKNREYLQELKDKHNIK